MNKPRVVVLVSQSAGFSVTVFGILMATLGSQAVAASARAASMESRQPTVETVDAKWVGRWYDVRDGADFDDQIDWVEFGRGNRVLYGDGHGSRPFDGTVTRLPDGRLMFQEKGATDRLLWSHRGDTLSLTQQNSPSKGEKLFARDLVRARRLSKSMYPERFVDPVEHSSRMSGLWNGDADALRAGYLFLSVSPNLAFEAGVKDARGNSFKKVAGVGIMNGRGDLRVVVGRDSLDLRLSEGRLFATRSSEAEPRSIAFDQKVAAASNTLSGSKNPQQRAGSEARADFVGTWSGMAHGGGSTRGFPVRLTVWRDKSSGLAGKASYPSFNCSTSLVSRSLTGKSVTFDEYAEVGCDEGNARVAMELSDGDSVLLRWEGSNGAEAVLTRE